MKWRGPKPDRNYEDVKLAALDQFIELCDVAKEVAEKLQELGAFDGEPWFSGLNKASAALTDTQVAIMRTLVDSDA